MFGNETCWIDGSACHQGRIPHYSASVQYPEQVKKAVLFAKTHNLRLVIKNTGHDGSGRSSSPDSVQIHTHGLKGIHYHPNFSTEDDNGDVTLVPAVTIGAGVMQWELYQRGAQQGFIVVGGECPTVGAAGGFLQGGGVSSFLAPSKGLAVDNVVEFQIVLANVLLYFFFLRYLLLHYY